MESIKLKGAQIIDTDRMKKSGVMRITLELTKNDTNAFCGTLAIAENTELLADIDINFTEIQGNDNGFEESIKASQKKKESLNQRFKRICIDYSGEEYYNRLKEHLGIDHLKELEKNHSESMIEDVFKCQELWIENQTMPFGVIIDPSKLTHKDNAYNLWKKLFENFNNLQHAKN